MKYTEEIIRQIEGSIKRGVSQTKTCDLVGISDDTFFRWMKKKEFSERIKKARANKIAFLLDNIRTAGLGELIVKCDKCGEEKRVTIPTRQWQALAWILERTEADEFVIKMKTEISGKDGDPIKFIEIGSSE